MCSELVRVSLSVTRQNLQKTEHWFNSYPSLPDTAFDFPSLRAGSFLIQPRARSSFSAEVESNSNGGLLVESKRISLELVSDSLSVTRRNLQKTEHWFNSYRSLPRSTLDFLK